MVGFNYVNYSKYNDSNNTPIKTDEGYDSPI